MPQLQDVAMGLASIDTNPGANPLVDPKWSSTPATLAQGWQENGPLVEPVSALLSHQATYSGGLGEAQHLLLSSNAGKDAADSLKP